MDTSESLHARDQPVGPEEPPANETTEMYRAQLAYYNHLRDERKRIESGQASRPISSGTGDNLTNDEDDLEENPRVGNGSADLDLIERRTREHHDRRTFVFDDHEQAPPPGPYYTPKIDIVDGTQPTLPYHSRYPPLSTAYRSAIPLSPPHPTPYRSAIPPPPNPKQTFFLPPPIPSNSAGARGPRIPSYNEHSLEFPEYEDYNEPRYGRRPPSFERRRAPNRHATAEVDRHKMPFYDPPFPGNDSSRPQKFWDAYNSDPNISGYRSGELQRGNPALPPETVKRRDQGQHIRPQYPPNQPSKVYSSHMPSTLHPFPKTTPRSRPYYPEPDTAIHDSQDHEVNSEISSSGDDEAWVDSEDIESQDSLQSNALPDLTEAPPPPILLYSNGDADEDLLNPSDWHRKLSVTEYNVKEHHNNRKNWPDTWRHSDIKTCPESLREVWIQILDVDHRVSSLGLDAALPMIDKSKYQLIKKGSLDEVVSAYKARSVQEARNMTFNLPSSSLLIPGQESWDDTCEQVQRLLKARDYLIAVCRDAEYLNQFHPTMDAITWFEQAQSVNSEGTTAARSEVIELMSLKILHLSKIIQSLNDILHALLWGWSDQSTICIQSDQETANKGEQDTGDLRTKTSNRLTKAMKLENTRSKTISSNPYDNGEKRIQTCIHTLELGLEALIDEVEVFAAILSQALFYQCDVLISDDLPHGEMVNYGRREISGLFFGPRGLKCMGELIQGRDVWVLEQFHNEWAKYPYVSPPAIEPHERASPHLFRPLTYIRTTIIDLARIWGPIFKASELTEGDYWLWYRLPGGYIGASQHRGFEIPVEADEYPSHFSATPDGQFGKCPLSEFFMPTLPYLLIGHGLPNGLVPRKSCQMSLESGLEGMALQLIGTLKPFRYKDSTSFNVAVGHAGTQVNWNTQIKTNPGILMKQSLLDRWKLDPKFRNPRLLLLWYGLEVSLCTRNARRCRLVDLIRSRSMVNYLSAIYRPEVGLRTYKIALFEALKSSNPNAFVELYDNHPEWQAELGTVVARCLEVLKESGVNRKRDLAAFAFIERFHDPEQLAILPRKDHTWVPLLKDSFDSATFAIMSDRCLGYPKPPGQTCRIKDRAVQASKSVLETSYTSTKRSDMSRLFRSRGMQVNQRITMRDSSKFKIKRRSSKGIILGTWHGGPSRYLHIPGPSEERFREKRQDGEEEIRAFVVSRRMCRLVRMRETPEATPVTNEDDVVSSHALSSNDVLDKPSSRPHRTAISPTPGEPLSTTTANPLSQRESRSPAMDDASTLRGDGTEHVDAGSQTSSPSTKPEKSAVKEGKRFREGSQSRVHKSTQTDIVHQQFVTTPPPTKNGEFLLPVPANGGSSSKLSHHTRGSGSDAGSDSTRRSHRNSSGSHGESNDSSSHRRRRHRRSHGDSSFEERYPRDGSLASKLGFGSSRR